MSETSRENTSIQDQLDGATRIVVVKASNLGNLDPTKLAILIGNADIKTNDDGFEIILNAPLTADSAGPIALPLEVIRMQNPEAEILIY